VGQRVTGSGGERASVSPLGFIELALLAQQDAELIVGGGVAGIDRKRAIELGARVVAPAVAQVDERQIHVRAGIRGVLDRELLELELGSANRRRDRSARS
jgi:isopentenyl diphosphate isomerase/L-lactate dehydrogenase-like FMN-dependent dehydrogenase